MVVDVAPTFEHHVPVRSAQPSILSADVVVANTDEDEDLLDC
jgi:hypothetical protein